MSRLAGISPRLCALLAVGLWVGCGGRAVPPPVVAPAVEQLEEPAPVDAERARWVGPEGPVVEIRVAFAAGSIDDPSDRHGLTALAARLMAEGEAGGISLKERQRRLYPMAAEIGVQVAREQTVFTARVHRDHLDGFYALLRDVLLDPAFRQEDLERVRDQHRVALVQRLRGSDDEALGKAALQAMLYEGHPYAHPEVGDEGGLEGITRDDIIAQRARVLCRERVSALVSGSVPDGWMQGLRRDLGALPSAACRTPSLLPSAPSLPGRSVWIVEKPSAKSIAVSMGFTYGVHRAHPDYPALMLAAAYLGQHRTFAGKLMQEIRSERGLNYGDYAYAEHFEQDGWTQFPRPNVARRQQYFSVWLRPLAPEHAHFAVRAAVRELEHFVEAGISQEEFERIRDFADRYYALFGQTAQLRLGHALDDVFHGLGDPGHLERLRAGFRNLSREQFHAAVRRHIEPARLQLAFVAPDGAALAARLTEDAPSPITYATEKPAEILAEDAQTASHPLGIAATRVRILPVDELFRGVRGDAP